MENLKTVRYMSIKKFEKLQLDEDNNITTTKYLLQRNKKWEVSKISIKIKDYLIEIISNENDVILWKNGIKQYVSLETVYTIIQNEYGDEILSLFENHIFESI